MEQNYVNPWFLYQLEMYLKQQQEQQPQQQQGGMRPSPQMANEVLSRIPQTSQYMQGGTGAGATPAVGGGAGEGGASGLAAVPVLGWIAAAVAAREGIGERGLGWVKGGVDDDVTRNLKSIGKAFNSWDDFTAGNMAGFGGGGLSKVQDVVSGKLSGLRKNDWMWLIDPIGQAISKLWK
jgi:hypothetical protein